jgi:DNA-binding MurR/RpiR family transcriptional regulator
VLRCKVKQASADVIALTTNRQQTQSQSQSWAPDVQETEHTKWQFVSTLRKLSSGMLFIRKQVAWMS